MNNEKEAYKGTSVIMRYTLRLLTAQQFERASRLIVSLEFLRRQESLVEYLKDEPITIGLWIGSQSTPNKFDTAKKNHKEIEEAADTDNSPQEKNKFQISFCPWCGTKLISKDKEEWGNAFKVSQKRFLYRMFE